jgi:hypothetical protein
MDIHIDKAWMNGKLPEQVTVTFYPYGYAGNIRTPEGYNYNEGWDDVIAFFKKAINEIIEFRNKMRQGQRWDKKENKWGECSDYYEMLHLIELQKYDINTPYTGPQDICRTKADIFWAMERAGLLSEQEVLLFTSPNLTVPNITPEDLPEYCGSSCRPLNEPLSIFQL